MKPILNKDDLSQKVSDRFLYQYKRAKARLYCIYLAKTYGLLPFDIV
jgi:hypothetical protein